MKTYGLSLPGSVYSGEDSISKIADILRANGTRHPVLFTTEGIRQTGLLDLVLDVIPQECGEPAVLDDLAVEPTYGEVQSVVDRCNALEADMLIAVGGGSVIDATKLVSLLINSSVTVKDLLDDPLAARKTVKVICVPTTAGTGAEATPNAIVAVPEKELKVGIVNPEMISDYVILDSRTTKNLPRSIAASTGVDALCHAVECFTSNKANPISDCFALRALEMIIKNIVPACDDRDALEAKEQMLIASFFAGIAITASGTTAVHALSYPLGGKYHIAHGVANAMLLTPVMRFNQPVIGDKLAEAYDRCFEPDGTLTAEQKADRIITRMEEIVSHLNIPTSLKEFNVPAEDLEGLVASGMDVRRLLDNNMREVTADDARAIYLQVM